VKNLANWENCLTFAAEMRMKAAFVSRKQKTLRKKSLRKKSHNINLIDTMKEKISNLIKPLKKSLVAVFCFALGALVYKYISEYVEEQRLLNYPFVVMKHEAELFYNEFKCELVKVTKAYIDSVAPTSSLNGYAVVDLCEQYDLDIRFVLAQGQVESHFGTKGMAAKTNSVFNVGAFDGDTYEQIQGRYKYKHPDYSIEPYIRLLYKDYIGGKRTELDLLAKYVNKNGKRYASGPDYENKLLALFKKIDETTNINYLQGEMRRYKIICGK